MHNPSPEDLNAVARLFGILADPTRLSILHLLKRRGGGGFVSDVVKWTGLKQSNVSKQLTLMHEAGMLRRDRDGNRIRYSIADPMIFQMCDLVCEKLHRQAQSQALVLRRVAG